METVKYVPPPSMIQRHFEAGFSELRKTIPEKLLEKQTKKARPRKANYEIRRRLREDA